MWNQYQSVISGYYDEGNSIYQSYNYINDRIKTDAKILALAWKIFLHQLLKTRKIESACEW
jgi:hypothetical protein